MSRKRLLLVFSLLGLLPLLSGCWDSQPIEDRAIVLTIGVAPGPSASRIRLIAQAPTVQSLKENHSASS
ncbi:MAG: hypothetical protein OWS74_08355, partial [Firmicutes bacterium]|nr:hypothetical protein [Bacillota bacterium]